MSYGGQVGWLCYDSAQPCVCAAGQAIEPSIERTIVDHLRNDRMVVDVLDVKSEEMGDGVFRRATCLLPAHAGMSSRHLR
jgi:hypothetical protein